MARRTLLLMIFAIKITAVTSFAWNTSDTINEQLCSGQNAIFNWAYNEHNDDRVISLEFYVIPQGATAEPQLIATYVEGQLLIPKRDDTGPEIEFLENAGIMLVNVTSCDSGTYFVVVNVVTGNHEQTFTHNATLEVSDPPIVEGDTLVVDILGYVHTDDGEWQLQLSCGNFQYRGYPEVSVVWTDSSAHNIPSTSFVNETFILSLSEDNISENYTCSVNESSVAEICHGVWTSRPSPNTVTVDENERRLLYLEANVEYLTEQLQLQQEKYENLSSHVIG